MGTTDKANLSAPRSSSAYSKAPLYAAMIAVACAAGLTYAKHRELQRDSQTTIVCRLGFEKAVLANIPQAVTLPQMARGLSNREHIETGMLFSWPDDSNRSFWMKDTFVALSVAFIDAEGVITQISDMQPNTETVHISLSPVREALELPTGQFERLGIKVGSKLLNKACGESTENY